MKLLFLGLFFLTSFVLLAGEKNCSVKAYDVIVSEEIQQQVQELGYNHWYICGYPEHYAQIYAGCPYVKLDKKNNIEDCTAAAIKSLCGKKVAVDFMENPNIISPKKITENCPVSRIVVKYGNLFPKTELLFCE